jgi:hypothetical protein
MKALNYTKTVRVTKPSLGICMRGFIYKGLLWNDAHMYLKYPGLSSI